MSAPVPISSLAQLPFPNWVHSLSAIAVGAKNGPWGEGKESSRVRGGTPERQGYRGEGRRERECLLPYAFSTSPQKELAFLKPAQR